MLNRDAAHILQSIFVCQAVQLQERKVTLLDQVLVDANPLVFPFMRNELLDFSAKLLFTTLNILGSGVVLKIAFSRSQELEVHLQHGYRPTRS